MLSHDGFKVTTVPLSTMIQRVRTIDKRISASNPLPRRASQAAWLDITREALPINRPFVRQLTENRHQNPDLTDATVRSRCYNHRVNFSPIDDGELRSLAESIGLVSRCVIHFELTNQLA